MDSKQKYSPDPKVNESAHSQDLETRKQDVSKESHSLNDSDMAGFPGLAQINKILENSDSLTNQHLSGADSENSFKLPNHKQMGENVTFQSPINQVQPS